MNPSQPLCGQTALVTGAAGGIGAAAAIELAARGASVVCADLRGAEQTVAAITQANGQAVSFTGDVTAPDFGANALNLAQQTFGRHFDIVVSNAGAGSEMKPIWETDNDTWQRDLTLNLTSHFMLAKAVIPAMRAAGYGRIVFTASAAGMEGHALAGGYAAAKAGLIAMTKTLGKELACDGVLVNAIAPALFASGLVEQPWFDANVKKALLERIPMKRLGKPEEAGKMIAFLASPDLTFSTGAVFDLSGGRASY